MTTQNLEQMIAAAKRLKEARAAFIQASGGAAPEARPESVAKADASPLVAFTKAKAERHRLTRLKIEEVSLVDAPGCPGALVVLRKRAPHPLIALAMARREAGR